MFFSIPGWEQKCILKRTIWFSESTPTWGICFYLESEYIVFSDGFEIEDRQLDLLCMFHLESWSWFSGWWFQRFFIFTPIWGKIPNLTNIFQKGLKPPTRSSFILHLSESISSLYLQLLKPLRFSKPILIIYLHISSNIICYTHRKTNMNLVSMTLEIQRKYIHHPKFHPVLEVLYVSFQYQNWLVMILCPTETRCFGSLYEPPTPPQPPTNSTTVVQSDQDRISLVDLEKELITQSIYKMQQVGGGGFWWPEGHHP